MFKILKKFISKNNKEGNMHSYFKARDDIEYFKINIGKFEYFVKTVQGELQSFFMYDSYGKNYRLLNPREELKLRIEFEKSYSFFKDINKYSNNNSLLPDSFDKAKINII